MGNILGQTLRISQREYGYFKRELKNRKRINNKYHNALQHTLNYLINNRSESEEYTDLFIMVEDLLTDGGGVESDIERDRRTAG